MITFTLNDVCTRWQLTEHAVVKLILSEKVYCQANPFRADSFHFYSTEEKKTGSTTPKDIEFGAAFKMAVARRAVGDEWLKNGHPPLKFTQEDILDAEARDPLLACVARSSSLLLTPQTEPEETSAQEDTPQALVARMNRVSAAPTEIIRALLQRWPHLKKLQIGAYAKGLDPNDPKTRKQAEKYYQRHKPKD